MKKLFEGINVEQKEKQSIEAAIVDIIRHGETTYKELTDRDFAVDAGAEDFSFKPEKLDLTEEGVENIYDTAKKLASMIDRNNEVIFFITSPQHRAQSSILIIEDVLAQNGITILNPSWESERSETSGLKASKFGLGQIPPHEHLLADGFGAKWLQSHKDYLKAHPEIADKPPAEVHRLVAASIGMELNEIFSKSHDDMAREFKIFLRHAINAKMNLSQDMKKALEGKRLRIVCVTHEERATKFAQEALGINKAVEKGQMLEVNPEGFIKKDSVSGANITLFGKRGNPDLSKDVEMLYSPDGLSVKEKEEF
jgi:broad specificity phosphatase PhoE